MTRIYSLICIVVAWYLVSISANKENIVASNDSWKESWINEANFTTMIRYSFPVSRCCNVYMNDFNGEMKILLHQFIRLYPYLYTLNANTNDCTGYFFLARTDEDIARTLNNVPSSTVIYAEILVLVNDRFEENDTNILFNASFYGSANVNVVTRSGIWSLSEYYLMPRVFRKVDKYEGLAKQSGIANLRGRELRVLTFYRPPVSYLNKTVKKVINGIEEEIFLAEDDLEKDGVEVKLLLLLAEKLNFTWIIKKSIDKYGTLVNNTWKGGIIKNLQEKKVDIGFATIWWSLNNHNYVNLTEPWHQLRLQFLVPRPRPISSFWALTRPFPINVWILLFLAILLQCLYIHVGAYIDPKFPPRFRNFPITLIEMMSRLLGIWIPTDMGDVRIQLHLWQAIGLVIVTAYSSSLAARLTSFEYEDRIDTVRQFLENNLWWGKLAPIPSFQDYFDYDDPYASQLPSRYHFIDNEEELLMNTLNHDYAIIGKSVESVFFPEDNMPNANFKNYRVMKETLGKFYVCFAVQPWLLEPINMMMLWFKESGITYFHLNDVIRRRSSFNIREVVIEHDGLMKSATILSMTPLAAGFCMLLVGLSISTIVFYFELRNAAGSETIRNVLSTIDKKRKSSITLSNSNVIAS